MIRAGSEWAVNSVLVFDGIAASRRRTSAARNSTNAGSVAQLSMRDDVDAARRGRGACAFEVLADRSRRVVGGHHQGDDPFDAQTGELLDRRLDPRVGVLEADRHGVRVGRQDVERPLEGVALRHRALGERRYASDRLVATDEVGQLLGGRRAAAADVGVVRLDLVRRAWRAVRHQQHGDPA